MLRRIVVETGVLYTYEVVAGFLSNRELESTSA